LSTPSVVRSSVDRKINNLYSGPSGASTPFLTTNSGSLKLLGEIYS
jgi:hypothetical protein